MSTRAATKVVHKLDFKEKLLEKGKRETAEGLSRKLKTLYQKLQVIDQELVDTKSLDAVKQPLVDNLILHHKDRGVKAYAACCLAEMLRLYAPDAPYTGDQLQNIFQFFSAQLLDGLRPPPNASRPLQPSRRTNAQESVSQTQFQSQGSAASQRIADAPYYTEYCLLLESLAEIKSIVLACDCPGGDDIVTGYFNGFVQIVRSDMSKNVIRHMTGILVNLIDESGSSLPSGVLDCIIDQFTRFGSTREPSFLMMTDVCNQVTQILQRPIYAHFAEIQLQHGRNPTSEDLDVMTESHKLLLTIWRNCPDLLPMVIPTLEVNLRAADEADIRALTTRTLGSMFSIRPRVGQSMAELWRSHPTVWKAWIGRKIDKVVAVRVAWVESTYDVLAQIGDVRRELENELIERIADANEQVRAAICKVIGKLDYETALHHVQTSTLQDIGHRINDKKAMVRNEATDALSKLWAAAYTEIEANESKAVRQFAWIPQAILNSTQVTQMPVEHRTALSAKFKEKILPLPAKPDDDQLWVERLLLVASHLDDPGLNGLERLTGLVGFARGSSPYRAFAQICEEWNGGIVEKDEAGAKARLNFVIGAIATRHFGEPEKAKKELQAFADTNDHRIFKLLNACANPESDLRMIIKSRNELRRRVEQSYTDLVDCVNVLIDNGTFNIVNSTTVTTLLRTLQTPPNSDRRDAVTAVAARLLVLISKECPPMYIAHVPELLVAIGQQKNDKLVEVSLQALASVCKYQPSVAPKDRKYVEKVKKIALTGTPRQAKFAARYMAYCGQEGAADDLVEALLDELDPSEDHVITHLRALAELALSSPKALEAKADQVHDIVMKKIIHAQSTSEDDAMDEWKPEEELDRIDQAKLLGLRLVTHRVIGFARDPEALNVAEPVFQLLDNILQGDGQISERSNEGGYAKTQIRLRAALCLIKLAQVRSFDRKMTRFFEPISYIMQDPCFQVRHRLLRKMGTVLPSQRMYARWNIMPAMLATDPEEENVQLARGIISSCISACKFLPAEERIDRVELPMARMLLVLAHHPDLDRDEGGDLEILKILARYIDLYIESVVNRDNVGMLYHIAAKVKTVKGLAPNGEPDEDNTNLYKLADVAQGIIKNKCEARHWSMTTYPGRIRMPKDVFHNLQNNQLASETMRKSYLNDEESEWLKSFGKKNASAGPSRRKDPMSSPAPERKTKVKAKKAKAVPRKRARHSGDTSEEESDEDDEEDEEGEEGEEDGDVEMDEEDESEEEEEGDEVVVGRGGRRGAKTKAKKGLKGKKKAKTVKKNANGKSKSASPVKKARRGSKRGESSDTGSELTAMEEDD